MKKIILVIAAALAIGAVFLFFLPVKTWFLTSKTWIAALGWRGPVAVALAHAALTVAMVPGSILTLGSGLLFGLMTGFAVAVAGANLGALGAFLLARTLLRPQAEQLARSHPTFAAIDAAMAKEGFKIIVLLRLSQVVPFTILNMLLGLTKVSLGVYVLANLVGMLFGTFVYVYLGTLGGAAAEGAPAAMTTVHVVGFAAAVTVTVLVTRLTRRALAEARNPILSPTMKPPHARESSPESF